MTNLHGEPPPQPGTPLEFIIRHPTSERPDAPEEGGGGREREGEGEGEEGGGLFKLFEALKAPRRLPETQTLESGTPAVTAADVLLRRRDQSTASERRIVEARTNLQPGNTEKMTFIKRLRLAQLKLLNRLKQLPEVARRLQRVNLQRAIEIMASQDRGRKPSISATTV